MNIKSLIAVLIFATVSAVTLAGCTYHTHYHAAPAPEKTEQQ